MQLRWFIHPFFLVYRVIFSPVLSILFQAQCRYEESCSRYTERMINENGIVKGSFFGIKRIISCSKWS